jgi:hypothetical protein
LRRRTESFRGGLSQAIVHRPPFGHELLQHPPQWLDGDVEEGHLIQRCGVGDGGGQRAAGKALIVFPLVLPFAARSVQGLRFRPQSRPFAVLFSSAEHGWSIFAALPHDEHARKKEQRNDP